MTLEELFTINRLATLGDVCAVGDIHPRDAREWAAEHGVSFIRGEYVFTFEEAEEMLEELADADGEDDSDEDELEPDEDEADADELESDEDSEDEDPEDEEYEGA